MKRGKNIFTYSLRKYIKSNNKSKTYKNDEKISNWKYAHIGV